MVYAAKRMANRIQVTTKQGKFVKEFILSPTTGQGGSTGGVAFSPEKAQRFLFISDLTNNHIWFLDRDEGNVVGQMGTTSQTGGQFMGLHISPSIRKATSTQVKFLTARRVQRFVPAK